MNRPESAMGILKHFVPPPEDLETGNYGFFVMREMIFCQIVSFKIFITLDLLYLF